MQGRDELIGSLIGLANTATGTVWKADAQTDKTVREALALLGRRAQGDILRQIDVVRAEKARLAPDCAVCKNPCGRNADYDMQDLYAAQSEIRALKKLLICALAAMEPTDADMPFVYDALRALGDEWTPERLRPIVLEAGERALPNR